MLRAERDDLGKRPRILRIGDRSQITGLAAGAVAAKHAVEPERRPLGQHAVAMLTIDRTEPVRQPLGAIRMVIRPWRTTVFGTLCGRRPPHGVLGDVVERLAGRALLADCLVDCRDRLDRACEALAGFAVERLRAELIVDAGDGFRVFVALRL